MRLIFLILAWVTFGVMIIAVTPSLCDPNARAFPYNINIALVVNSTLLVQVVSWSSYNQPHYTDCDTTTSRCRAQIFLISWFFMATSILSFWFCYRLFCDCLRISHLSENKYLSFVFNGLKHTTHDMLVVYGSTTLISFTFALTLLILGLVDPSNIIMSVGGYCTASNDVETPSFYIFVIPIGLLTATTLCLSVFTVIQLSCHSVYVLRLQMRATCMCIAFWFSCCVFLVSLGIRYYQQSNVETTLASLYCIITHPREADPPCSPVELYPAALPAVLVTLMLSLSIDFSIIAFLSFPATWVWWWRLVCGNYTPIRKLQREIAHNLTPTSGGAPTKGTVEGDIHDSRSNE